MQNELEKRMKENYENRTRIFLPRRTYTLIRLDGKAFHTLTKGMDKPYDNDFIAIMNATAKALCKTIQGCVLGYVQSDEISLLLTDFNKISTDAWFDGNIQKIVSVSASMAAAYFNLFYMQTYFGSTDRGEAGTISVCEHFVADYNPENEIVQWNDILNYFPSINKLAIFDSRVFTIPDPIEVENYFIWRQKDAVRNSISMTAQNLYSTKELHGKSTNEMQEMIFQKGQNWNDMPVGFKRGRIIVREPVTKYIVTPPLDDSTKVVRNEWIIKDSIDFIKEREKFRKLIPILGY